MRPNISIILPFYNAQKTLSRALDSIIQQEFQNYECLLIDNNSDDESFKIAEKYCQSDKRFKLKKETKQGVVYASNTGSRLAVGDYNCRMDADDEMTKDSLAVRKEYLDRHSYCDVVCGQVEYISHQADTRGFQRYVEWSNSVLTYEDILKKRFVESPVINPTAMWRNHIADRYGMYRQGDFPEDYELWLRWLHEGVKINKLKRKVLRWYDSESRLTRTSPVYSEKAFFSIKSKYLSLWLKNNNVHHPEVWVWGASRRSRRWARHLLEYGIIIKAYIDVHRKRRSPDLNIIYYKDLPSPEGIFLLAYNRHHDQKKEIAEFLESRNFEEGKNYLFAG